MPEEPDLPWSDQPVWKSIDCGPGWWPIIAGLDQDLRALYPEYRVVQVKEKFGGLRYYTEGVGEAGKRLIRLAEQIAEMTCEECGQPGKPRSRRGWMKTLCDTDAAEWSQR
jgi:hypothetical protein